MRAIKKFVDSISEEIEDAKNYAEKYVESKAKGDMSAASKFKEMSGDELKHAMYLHDMVTKEIEQISKVYTPPIEMEKKWEESHREYVEKVALVRQMLAL